MALWFYVEYIDDEILIPEGEYTIDNSNDYWSVIQGDGSLGKSFYSTHDGEYFTSLYFLVAGTVEVTKKNGKLHLEMHAVNSYDVPVHVIYNPSETGLRDIDIDDVSSVQKRIIDGQLVIIRNSQAFNMMGVLVK